MTSHTETTSKVTETINSIDYNTGWQYSVTGTNVNNGDASLNPSNVSNTVMINPLGGIEGQVSSTTSSANLGASNFKITDPKEAFQFTQTYSGPGMSNQTIIQRVTEVQHNRYHKCLYPIIALLIASPVRANVGGVSATANPIANSSGSQ